ncbi:MAG: Protein phosphatase 2C 1 [Cirrosporium novae-zelandiae]|nr:MAG: Protein phosphatase 2C 1 [Cirrosporium novae-zelandiae]
MFGSSSSPPKEEAVTEEPLSSPADRKSRSPSVPDSVVEGTEHLDDGAKKDGVGKSPAVKKAAEDPTPVTEKKRRSSGVARATALFSSAKNSLHLSHTHNSSNDSNSAPQTPMQKLGKTDPVLNVPQGSLNNSAGDSHPGPRSSFKVGVTEDRNKKCRRTMEDTHAYLYNFLGTPAPALELELKSPKSPKPTKDKSLPDKESSSLDLSSAPVVETDNGYFSIFDGHAGTFAAEWCGKKLHVLLEEAIRKNPNTPIPELLDQTFTTVDQQLEKLPLKNSGCTAVCAVLRWEDRIPNPNSATGSTSIAPAAAAVAKAMSDHSISDSQLTGVVNQTAASISNATAALPKLQESASRHRVLYTANVGDARIVLCRNGKALRLSYDHKGSDENEGKRIANAGGLILNNRVNGVLAVTRALGDSYMKDLVTGHPYTTETVIQPDMDEFLILACDGLWDVCTDQEAVDLIRNQTDPQAASKVLVDHAMSRFSTDNVTVMIVRFDNNKLVQNSLDKKAGPIGVEGDPPTKEGGVSEADHIVAEAKKTIEVKGEKGDIGSPERAAIIREESEKEPGPELTPPPDVHK